MSATAIFEPVPRWPGAPQICMVANLPAFTAPSLWSEYESKNCPGAKVLKKWICSACGCWHFWCVMPGPAGSSSGTDRSTKSEFDEAGFFERFQGSL